jgi:hypothetical protein
MKPSLLAFAIPVPLLVLSPVVKSPPTAQVPTTFTIASSDPVRPVRFTVIGSGAAIVTGDSLRAVGDTVIASTPADLVVGDGPVLVVLTATGEPSLVVSADDGRLKAWANRVEIRRDRVGAALRVLAPTLRWTTQ